MKFRESVVQLFIAFIFVTLYSNSTFAQRTMRETLQGIDAEALLVEGTSLMEAGRYRSAESSMLWAIEKFTEQHGRSYIRIAFCLANLSRIHMELHRIEYVLPLLQRAMYIVKQNYQKDSEIEAYVLMHLAIYYSSVHLYPGTINESKIAEVYFNKYSNMTRSIFGADHFEYAQALTETGNFLNSNNRHEQAIDKFLGAERILAHKKNTRRDIAIALHNGLGIAYKKVGDLKKSSNHYELALNIQSKTKNFNSEAKAKLYANMAILSKKLGNKSSYLNNARLAFEADQQYFTNNPTKDPSWFAAAITNQNTNIKVLISALYEAGDPSSIEESFKLAQQSSSSQAAASIQMYVNRLMSDPQGKEVFMEMKELADRTERTHRSYVESVASINAPRTDLFVALLRMGNEMREKAASYEQHNPVLKQQLKTVSIRDVQENISPHEVVILLLDPPHLSNDPYEGSQKTFVWIISKNAAPRWIRADLTTEQLGSKIAAIRCGVDRDDWEDPEKGSRCQSLVGTKAGADEPLPFDLNVAYGLYRDLFGEVEDLIKNKELIIVPSGRFTSLPLQVLVTDQPKEGLPRQYDGYRGVSWLGRERPIVVLPLISSLQEMGPRIDRRTGSHDYAAWGAPKLNGNTNCSQQEGRKEFDCAALSERRAGAVRESRRSVKHTRSTNLDRIYRSGRSEKAIRTELLQNCPLPDSADEIRCIADSLRATSRSQARIRLGEAATENDIKVLSENRQLEAFSIIHFATHGVVAGKLGEEPGLIMTPPPPGDAAHGNEGLLRASEIARLRMNADWVILSACNTAAGTDIGAEALSGLTSSFFSAGARSVLVSHWPVYSDAAVALMSHMFRIWIENSTMTRAEALRLAMIELMDQSTDHDDIQNVHPEVWAPFSVVGNAR